VQRARAQQEREGGPRRRLGHILVEMGSVTERELAWQMEFHVEESVFELLSWAEGFFSFAEGDLAGLPSDVAVRIPVEKLLMEGARRIDEWSRLEAHLPHLNVVPLLSEGGGGDEMTHLHLRPDEWLVLAQVDGVRDVRAIASSLVRPEFEVAKTLFGLVSIGIITVSDPVPAAAVRSSGMGDDVGALLAAAEVRLEAGELEPAKAAAQAAIGLRPHEARAHLLLGRAYLAEGHVMEAVDACRRALRFDAQVPDGRRWLGCALAATGRFREARESLELWQGLSSASAAAPAREGVAELASAVAVLERHLEAVRG
jgi:tetratricopeptide (TPR) repeat protein